MGVHHTTRKLFQTFKVRHIWRREMTCSNHYIIKLTGFLLTRFMIHHSHSKFLCFGIKSHPAYWALKTNVLTDTLLINASHDVIFKDFARRVRRDRLTKVLFKRIVRKFKTLFWAIGPQVTVHTAMYWLTILV